MPILASDNFTPNANPLNPTNWTTVTGSAAVQAVSGFCEPTAATVSRAVYTKSGITFPADQYSRAVFSGFDGGSTTVSLLSVRASAVTAALNYQVQITWNTQVYRILVGGTSLTSGSLNTPPVSGDVFMIASKGTTITLYQNGVACVNSASDGSLSAGGPGIGFLTSTIIASDKWSSWDSGSIVTTAAPTFSPVAGTYSTAQTITITSTTPSSTIYYTTDGTTPTTASAHIPSGGTVTISTTATLKAIALSNGPLDSVSTETDGLYTISGGGGGTKGSKIAVIGTGGTLIVTRRTATMGTSIRTRYQR